MPIIKGSSEKDISKNIAELVSAGHSEAQAAAIAYKVAGKDERPQQACDMSDEEWAEMQSLVDKWIQEESKEPEHAQDGIALDRQSVRSFDANGYLRVEKSNISKANICAYAGKEIPNWQALGLNPTQQYLLYRDPDELARAVDTFKNIPLLNTHIPFDTKTPPKDAVVGSVGSNVDFNGIYLTADLIVTDANAIALIESEQQKELSPGYRYTADMTAGEVKGQKYDGVMRNIVGNHLALVDVGRTGSDVVVGDSQPNHGNISMKIEDIKKAMAQDSALKSELRKVLGMDEKSEDDKQAEDEDEEGKQAQDEDDGEKAESERKKLDKTDRDDKDAKKDDLAEDDDDESESKQAMDAATIERRVTAKIEQKFKALRKAEQLVKPLVGEVTGMDSAAQVYHFALDSAGNTHHKSINDVAALEAMWQTHLDSTKQKMAADRSPVHAGDLSELFPSMKKGV